MNFILPGANVKMLARAVNCFSKIGNELFFEATPDGLDLKTINSTNTAYAVVQFRRDFFITFQQGNSDTPDENCCKISVKPILKIFKSLATIQTCKIWLETNQSKIIFQFRCKSDVLKTHKIYLLESEHINSLNLSQTFPSEIVGNHKVFTNILVHLYHSVDEISFDLNDSKTVVSNYVDNDQADRSTLRSTLSIDSTAFQTYQLASKANLIFCYKEFKAVTMFAALNKLNIKMSFSGPGSPLMLEMSKGEIVHAKFIMGTMKPSAQLNSRRANRRKALDRSINNRSVGVDSEAINTYFTEDIRSSSNTEAALENGISQAAGSKTVRDTMNTSLPALRNETDCNTVRNERSHRPVEANSVRQRSNTVAPSPSVAHSSEAMFGEKNTENLPFLEGLNFRTPTINRLESIPTMTTDDSFTLNGNNSNPPQEPVEQQLQQQQQQGLCSVSNLSAVRSSASLFSRKRPPNDGGLSPGKEKPPVDSVPESPDVIAERKRKQAKLRHIFRRCFEPTFNPAFQDGCSQIYAPNSDTEDDVDT
ncbi:cell cycle checkpoint control protein RAD9B [Anopheles maculipalpis]|uniref:cell cycle checkpoint control protein RAD9B n=1 Tax=Anopheles maculipalpis TaxID=1496333 RepID=UPI002159418A|nr:cell cycle checkpoint control protein RAD9B [Anopheles maculipalpis]XP_050069508.1 cell cycle checkpoint control protein RAD9B [Anopheles maculipalpis]